MTKREKKLCSSPGCQKKANIDFVMMGEASEVVSKLINRPNANYYCVFHWIGLVGILYKHFKKSEWAKYLEVENIDDYLDKLN